MFFFFFFQAEDGIRDLTVTGVQTCALPISIATDRNAAVMNILRFSDLCAQGKAQGQRVFIRADLNVPLNDAGEITEDTRVRASVPAIEMALKAGAAVMVTSHLGRPTEGEFRSEEH